MAANCGCCQFRVLEWFRVVCVLYRPAVKVLLDGKDQSLVLRDALDLVAPLPCNLDGSLDSFGTSVHWQNHLEAQHSSDRLCETWKHIVVKSTRAEGEPRGLVAKSLDEFGMAVALIDGAVCGKEVQVLLPCRKKRVSQMTRQIGASVADRHMDTTHLPGPTHHIPELARKPQEEGGNCAQHMLPRWQWLRQTRPSGNCQWPNFLQVQTWRLWH